MRYRVQGCGAAGGRERRGVFRARARGLGSWQGGVLGGGMVLQSSLSADLAWLPATGVMSE